MSFWNFFGKKEKENVPADSSAGLIPIMADSDSSDSDAPPHSGNDATNATTTDSGTGFFGGDGGGAGGGDGGGT